MPRQEPQRTTSPARSHAQTPSGHKPGERDRATPAGGETIAAGDIGAADRRRDPLPHEHDESSRSQASASQAQERVGRQALADLEDGRQDTDRGPVADETYHRMASPGTGSKGAPPRR